MITTFTRLHIEDIDTLIDDEELVHSLVTDLGFDSQALQQLAGNAESADPETLFRTLESRWNGYGQGFSLEDQIDLLTHALRSSETHKSSAAAQLQSAGRATPISVDGHPVRLLAPTNVEAIHHNLDSLPLENLQAIAQKLLDQPTFSLTQAELVSAPLWQLYDGLTCFFENATNDGQFILMAQQDLC
jgi:hypothetical protein